MGIKNALKNVGNRAGDRIARLSSLSPEQLEQIQNKRAEYLAEKPDPGDDTSREQTERLLAAASIDIYNAYLPQLKELYLPLDADADLEKEFDPNFNIRYFNITKWVTDKKENSIEKLINVYEVLSNEQCNIALVFHRTRKTTDVYLAVTNTNNDYSNTKADNYSVRLAEAVKGNFPGSELSEPKRGFLPCIKDGVDYSVATVSNIPAEKSEKYISQTIEKLLDGIIPDKELKSYTLILLATPIKDISERKIHLAELYSALTPFAQWSTSYTVTDQDTRGASASVSINVGASAGIQQGQNQSTITTDGTTNSNGKSVSDSNGSSTSTNNSNTSSNNSAKNVGTSNSSSHQNSDNIFRDDKDTGSVSDSTMTGHSSSYTTGKSESETRGNTFTRTLNRVVTKTLSKAVSHSVSTAEGLFRATNFGVNVGAGFARSSNVSVTVGKSEAINQNFSNYNIKHTLEVLEEQMKRYEECTALGMWDFAAYVLSGDCNVANNVARSYLALTQGEESYMSTTAVNLWDGSSFGPEADIARVISKYIKEMRHPLFSLNPAAISEEPDFYEYPTLINATTALSGKELAYSLNFPQKSISGLPVLKCAEFGRNITKYDISDSESEKIHLGNIFNMNHVEPVSVDLDLESLSAHTFITGSTGSGKSNTVYKIINEALKAGRKFMVVEPAKGEYKDVFGNRDDVNVFGTNPEYSEILKINPFSFPDKVHVFEHLERLVELFNVCWPMYAAMPAVLKNAVQKSYEDCGWDLNNSTNKYDRSFFPTFSDVARNIKDIIDSSEYDSDNKGAYKGSLLTRLKSLTDGINGMIFVKDEVPAQILFDENTIIDLSRVGSSETKSLIMGMMVLKLQEYRMSKQIERNSAINHFTVLEEAHNLLKRSMPGSMGDGGDLLGKSVEMISNAIAEMRTFGEGFIIVDQSPGLLDMAAIRNTNTKIIMRLPDKTDRELVGYAANLNDDQIIEIAKLPRGVGAVYQNDWVEPILCRVDKADTDSGKYKFEPGPIIERKDDPEIKLNVAAWLSHGTKITDIDCLKDIKDDLINEGIDPSVVVAILRYFENPVKEPRMTKLGYVMSALFPSVKEAVKTATYDLDKKEWIVSAEKELLRKVGKINNDQLLSDITRSIITYYCVVEVNKPEIVLELMNEGGYMK